MATSKKRGNTILSILEELDRPLYEGKWQDVQYILRKKAKKKPNPPVFTPFIEALQYLEDYTMEKLTRPLHEIEELLKTALDSCLTEDHALIRVMIKIKQGQFAWINNEIGRALSKLPQISAARVDNAPIHTSKVFMEGSLYTGLCTEIKHTDQTDKLLIAVGAYEECLRLALDITILAKSSGLVVHPAVFRSIRTSLERGPILCIKLGEPSRAVGFFRRVLMAKEEYILPQIRQICATGLASSLLFFISPGSYRPFTFSQSTYSPSQLTEEAILATSLMKTFLGTLQDTKIQDAVIVFDMLTLAFTDARLPGILVQTLEDSMPFTSSGPHLWLHFALALINNNLHYQAEAVFHECVRIYPSDPHIILMGSNFTLESLNKPELSIQWIQPVLELAVGHFLEPKLYFVLGKAQGLLAEKELTFEKRQTLLKKSLDSLKHATELDPHDIDFIFYYAIQLAIVREIAAAREQIQQALALCHDHTGCLHLLALLLSADKQYTEALKICELALHEDPNNLNLTKTKILLQVVVSGVQPALQTCKNALKIWQRLYSEESTGLIGAITQDQRSLSDLQLKTIDRDEQLPSYTISPEVASDAGSSHFSISNAPSLNTPILVQAQLWCTIANVFIKNKKFSDAALCVQEAQFLAPYLPVVSITNGKVLESEKQLEVALDQYNNALVLKPFNTIALTSIGRLLHLSGKNEPAEKHLREALAIDKLNHEAWFWLGKVFADQNDQEHASNCFKTALQFESSAPIQKFEAVLHRNNALL